jgi:hypothetical protein
MSKSKSDESRYEYSDECRAELKHNSALDSERVKREWAGRPSYLNDIEFKQKNVGLAITVSALWMSIEELVPGRANRIALGRKFQELQRIYSEKNIGGNRRTSGHGTFEKECEQRGYPARTVRGWIADYEAGLTGGPTEAQKRAARTKGIGKEKIETNPLASAWRLVDKIEDLGSLIEMRERLNKKIAQAEAREWTTPLIEEVRVN